MQYRDNRSGYASGDGLDKISKRSTRISFFIHIIGISFLFISPMRKQINKDSFFTVQIIDIPAFPAPQVISQPLEQIPAELPKAVKETPPKDIPADVKEDATTNQRAVQREIPAFSAEKYRETLIAKTTNSSSEKPAASKQSEKPVVNIDKIERIPAQINISSLMSIPDWYLSSIHKTIKENWRTDNIIGQRTAIISFRIHRNGKIENVALERSSGNTRFDKSVLEAVISTRDVPSFPVEITHNYLDIIIDFKTEG